MKTVGKTLSVAARMSSNSAMAQDQGAGHRSDVELPGTIRTPFWAHGQLIGAARSPRSSSESGDPTAWFRSTPKRVYELMTKYALLLERHAGCRRSREHNRELATIR